MQASRLFSSSDREAIAAAVAAAERQTAGEIVPVVASASGRYDRAEDLFGVVVALVAVAVVWTLFQQTGTAGGWDGLAFGLVPVLVTFLLGFLLGAALATRFPVLRLPFISKGEMTEEVERRAVESFQRLRVRATAGGTGVLIYVSLYERMVRVLGDDTVDARLEQAQWEEVCTLVTAALAEGKPAAGLIAAIGRCGELLAEHFPPRDDDENELANNLHIID